MLTVADSLPSWPSLVLSIVAAIGSALVVAVAVGRWGGKLEAKVSTPPKTPTPVPPSPAAVYREHDPFVRLESLVRESHGELSKQIGELRGDLAETREEFAKFQGRMEGREEATGRHAPFRKP